MHHMNECGCGQQGHGGHGMGHQESCSCGCGHGHGHGMHRFPSKEEIMTGLEEYLKHLQAAAKEVEEKIAEFKKAS